MDTKYPVPAHGTRHLQTSHTSRFTALCNIPSEKITFQFYTKNLGCCPYLSKMNSQSTEIIPINSSLIFVQNFDVPMNVRPLSLAIQRLRICIIVFGTFINLIVVVTIRYSRQLHYPRHLFWAAISLINQLCIIQAIVEIFAIVFHDRVACQIFVLNAGVHYTIILTFLALAALDRYLAIARYEWYKKKVTNRKTIYLLFFIYVITYFSHTSPFWTGFKNIRNCTINLTHMHVALIYDLFLGILCVVLHVMIFIRSRAAIKKQPSFLQTSIALKFLQTPSKVYAYSKSSQKRLRLKKMFLLKSLCVSYIIITLLKFYR